MSAPVRIRLSRAKGWRMPENTVRVSRPGKWGNPFDFRAGVHGFTALAFGCRGDRAGRQAASVKAYRDWIDPGEGRQVQSFDFQVGFERKDGRFHGLAPRLEAGVAPTYAEIRSELAGKNLACWCALDAPCHADVLLELANRPVCEQVAA